MTDYSKLTPIVIIAVSVIATAVAAQIQIQSNSGELTDLSESVDENEENIELIQRTLIQRQGETRLQVQRIETEQKNQGDDLDQILLILKQIQPN